MNPDQIKEITFTLPIPSRKLSPNARVHYMAKAREVKALRQVARLTCHDALCGLQPQWKRAIEKSTFYFTTHANRDGDNLLSMLKPVWDGFQDAGLVSNDSGITHEPVESRIDKAYPRVEIRIRKEEKVNE